MALSWMLLLKCTQPWSLRPLGSSPGDGARESSCARVSETRQVREVPQRAPVPAQPLDVHSRTTSVT
jgi:hypothetical protein